MISTIGYLECVISPGMFANEYAVTVVASGTQLLSPAEALTVKRDPVNGTPGEAMLRVRVLETSGNRVLVAFPQEAFASTSRLFLPKDAVHSKP